MSRAIGERFEWADGAVGKAIECVGLLRDSEADFILDLADKLGRYGAKTFMSGKQIAWLEDIEKKIEEEP